MQIIWFIVQITLTLVVAQLVLGPVVVYFVIRHAATPQFRSFELLNPPLLLPPSYTQNIARLEELGFDVVAHLFGSGNTTTTRYVLTLFVNQSEKDKAIVVHMLSEIPPVTRLVVNYVEFYTDFEDGSEVNTINSKLPSSFVPVPEKKIFRLPHLTEPKQLYFVHRALVARGPAVNKQLPAAGEEVSDLVAGMDVNSHAKRVLGG